MSEFFRRYGRLSDHLYKFIAALVSCHARPDWPEREEIEMALRFIKRLEELHWKEKEEREWEEAAERRERRKKKQAAVVKLVTDGKDAAS